MCVHQGKALDHDIADTTLHIRKEYGHDTAMDLFSKIIEKLWLEISWLKKNLLKVAQVWEFWHD